MMLAPSILSADFANLERDIVAVAGGGADYIHVDVMDGHFVPNITIGARVVQSIKRISPLPLDVHLMIENASKYLADFAAAGADIITIHTESADAVSVRDNLMKIRALGCKAGLSIKPGTDVSALDEYLPLCDLILLMTVEPGFGGQEFIGGSLERIAAVRAAIDGANPGCILEIDGGVNESNIADCVRAGAELIVAGSAVYKPGCDCAERVRLLKDAARSL